MLKFDAKKIINAMAAKYDKGSTARLTALQNEADQIFRGKDDNMEAHIATLHRAMTEAAHLRGEVSNPSDQATKLRSSIHNALMIADMKKNYDVKYPNIMQRTYQTLVDYLTEHCDRVLLDSGNEYAHSIVVDTSNAQAFVAAVMDATINNPGFLAALSIKAAGGGPATPAAHVTQQQRRPAPPPKTAPPHVAYCHRHGYSVIATGGHSGAECTTMQNPAELDKTTGKPFTEQNRQAKAHVLNANGTVSGSYAGFGKV